VLSQDKTPKGVRIAEIILGVIAIALAAYVISNPEAAISFHVMILGIILLVTGVSRIIVGGVVKQASGKSRVISIGTGIISIIGGAFAIANPIEAIDTLIWIVSIIIIIHGLGLIGSGITSRGADKGSRIPGMVLGAIAVGFASILLAFPELAKGMIVFFMAIGLFSNGMASIVSGITGNKIASPVTK
jgi:uncharacterized membrane protein HdeD (DUF308 family)